MRKKYVVRLKQAERETLEQTVNAGNMSARKLTHAWILIKSDTNEGVPNWSYRQVCEALDVSEVTVYQVLKAFMDFQGVLT